MKVEVKQNTIGTTCECGKHLSQLIIDGYDLTPLIGHDAEHLRQLLSVIYVAVLPRIKAEDVSNADWSHLERVIEKAINGQPFVVPTTWPR